MFICNARINYKFKKLFSFSFYRLICYNRLVFMKISTSYSYVLLSVNCEVQKKILRRSFYLYYLFFYSHYMAFSKHLAKHAVKILCHLDTPKKNVCDCVMHCHHIHITAFRGFSDTCLAKTIS